VILGGLFVLAFFTIHFGGFHYIHSQFLIAFFPINREHRTASLPIYMEVARRYRWVLPSALLAERGVFLRRTSSRASAPPDMSATPAAITARKTASARKILFGVVHAARLDGFAVYAFVYALYFFLWRLLRRDGDSTAILDGSLARSG
jgi:hypothetical protein